MSSWHGSGSAPNALPAGLTSAARRLDSRYLTRRAEHCFEPAVQRRGADYFRSGDVTHCRGNDLELTATVAGSDLYQVRAVVLGPDELGVLCSCPVFVNKTGFCKHLWAVFLQAEQRGLLRNIGGGPGPIELVGLGDGPSGFPPPPSAARTRPGITSLDKPPEPPTWRDLLRDPGSCEAQRPSDAAPANGPIDLGYVLLTDTTPAHEVTVQLWLRPGDSAGGNRWRPAEFNQNWLDLLREPVDREMLLLLGLKTQHSGAWPPPSPDGVVRVPAIQALDLLRRLCATGRCHLGSKVSSCPSPLAWGGDEPWRLELELTEPTVNAAVSEAESDPGPCYTLRGLLVRAVEKRSVAEAEFLGCGMVVVDNALGPCAAEHDAQWMEALSRSAAVSIPSSEVKAFIRQYYRASAPPPLRLPPGLVLTPRDVQPEFVLDVLGPDRWQGLTCSVSAVYGSERVSLGALGTRVVDFEACAIYGRILEAEQQAKTLLRHLGFRGSLLDLPAGHPGWGPDDLRLPKSRLPATVQALIAAGWRVLAQGKTYRPASSLSVAVSSGLDWLDLSGGASFEGVLLGLPELLSALARRERTVLLDDGTLGMLPEEWLERWGLLAELSERTSREAGEPAGKIRLRRVHAGLVAALLETVDHPAWDSAFEALRNELLNFRGLEPAASPPDFVGTLRSYQSDGLAWLEFLARLGFGGCLADDMGLGKTIQVLALLLKRHAPRSSGKRRSRAPRPSLIVVPRSLVHNWIDEARRFAPRLRLLCHVGSDRDPDLSGLSDHDILVTSYGTLLRDLEQLRQIEFDCVVLDEAQAIKTSGTQTAKAVRLLRGAVRIALTGTPVENHLGELWSLFDFLNPGLLGGAVSLKRSVSRAAGGEPHELLRDAIRPFVLRRTKSAVAKDLPRRSEETLWVELDRDERRHYDELFVYYQACVRKRVAQMGVDRSTPFLLEALLRLRQAACHRGLIDRDQRHQQSAKLEVLLEHLLRLGEEGHKALVFSQFTSLLAIVRERLDQQGVAYEYLDGKTRDRRKRVARFQQEPDLRLFLISLKAGGLGLNLTAADYVFILDPWWNPAVEAQAIDRTHRIGQSRHVFAYRLIARNTVEERVAELQRRKRKLVEAILGEQSGLAGKLTRADFEYLLG